MAGMTKRLAFTVWLGISAVAGAAAPAFVPAGPAFRFDTGALRGTLRAQGQSLGLTELMDAATGVPLARSMGCCAHYRLLSADARYGTAAWDWASTARLLPDGSVEAHWSADAAHPFTMRAVYRWASSNALDVTTTVVADKALRQFEVFFASYFEGFPAVYGYTQAGFVAVQKSMGDWLAFPRDAAVAALLADGRWQRPPNPVTFKPVATYAAALGLRRDASSGLAALVMAPTNDCFAVLMPHSGEAHRSLYLSLLGRDLNAGEQATARARLVIGRHLTDEQAVEIYRAYLRDLRP